MRQFEIKTRATRVVVETWVLWYDADVTTDTAMSALSEGVVNRTIMSVVDDPEVEVTREPLSVQEIVVNEDAQSLTEGGGDEN